MDSYFSRFPNISYNGYVAKNIMLRTKLIQRVYDDPKYFYSVEIRNGVRPDSLAYDAYDDQYLSWLVYMANDVVDPYYQWALSQYDFDRYIEAKYGSIANAQGRVIQWQNNWYSDTDNITISQYNKLEDYSKEYYEPVLVGNKVLEYRRRQTDNIVNTNEVWQYNVNNSISFSFNNDEKITVYNSTNEPVANGQLLFANSSVVRLHHIFADTTESPNTQIGILSNQQSNASILSAQLLARNIPIEERVYWSAVTYYDIEQEKNANNANVRILSREHSARAALQLKRLLNP